MAESEHGVMPFVAIVFMNALQHRPGTDVHLGTHPGANACLRILSNRMSPGNKPNWKSPDVTSCQIGCLLALAMSHRMSPGNSQIRSLLTCCHIGSLLTARSLQHNMCGCRQIGCLLASAMSHWMSPGNGQIGSLLTCRQIGSLLASQVWPNRMSPGVKPNWKSPGTNPAMQCCRRPRDAP